MSILGKLWISTLRKFSFVKGLEERVHQFEKYSSFEPGHFYSPLVDPEEFRAQENKPESSWKYIPPEIEFNEGIQIKNRESFEKFYDEFPYNSIRTDLRFRLENEYFTYSDAFTMYSMIREHKPQKIIEIGSGFSSALILDTNQLFFDNSISMVFIDPNPERLLANIRTADRAEIIRKKIQDVDIAVFKNLKEGDFLLIDTSHVSKSGSDVNHIYFNILPYLNKGVKIHIHDIFFPFEYPEKWVVEERRSWNEIFMLRAFLSFNNSFDIIYFNSFMEKRYRPVFERKMPAFLKTGSTVCGGIWLEKNR